MTNDMETLLARRKQFLGPGLRQFYDFPFRPVRGEGVWLYDEAGRAYLDAYNNVPHVGHAHPDVVAALSRQAAKFNTNTRYLDQTIVDYADRLQSTLPDGLDVCLFVCTGSEANDLAWRLARAFTGGDGVIASRHAYHGNTSFLATFDSYQAELPRPDSVVTVPAPSEVASFEAAFGEAIETLESSGHRLAAAYFDTCFANEGLMPPQPEQMRRAVSRVKAAGGLYVADEVQAGLGRLGDGMWGFQSFGVTPDIVTMGKPLGNGHPIGAVVTRREIVEAFYKRERYFNTFGGNPVSAAAGLAVLEVLDREQLVRNAERTGAYLAALLYDLAKSEPRIEARGRGFFQGVAIRDAKTGAAAPEAARATMNALAREGVLVGLTGIEREVLKIRPPMPFDRKNADQLVATLAKVLRESGAPAARRSAS
jgi:4-aminobutyrate aminotransferase-like enzyme